jgi:hypothetical protein
VSVREQIESLESVGNPLRAFILPSVALEIGRRNSPIRLSICMLRAMAGSARVGMWRCHQIAPSRRTGSASRKCATCTSERAFCCAAACGLRASVMPTATLPRLELPTCTECCHSRHKKPPLVISRHADTRPPFQSESEDLGPDALRYPSSLDHSVATVDMLEARIGRGAVELRRLANSQPDGRGAVAVSRLGLAVASVPIENPGISDGRCA